MSGMMNYYSFILCVKVSSPFQPIRVVGKTHTFCVLMSNPKPQIFLSYSHSDLETVGRLYEELKARELNIWFDKEDIGIGKWKPKTTKAIMQSRYFIFCISEVALSRINADPPSFQDEELTYALEIALNQDVNKFSIIPVRLDDCDHGDHRISVYNQFDLFKDWENDLDRLAFQMGGKSRSGKSETDQRSDLEKKIDDRLNKAEALYYAKEYKKGVALLQAIIEFEESPSARSHNLLGIMYSALSKYKKALSTYESALEIDPKYAKAWNNKGLVLGELGREREALEVYDRALEIDPKNAMSWNNKGNDLMALGRDEEALKAYESALGIDPKYANAWYNKGIALSALGRHEESQAAFAEAKRLEATPNESKS